MEFTREEEMARRIVFDWWKTQDYLIPTTHLQQPLIDAIAVALLEERMRAAIKVCPWCRGGRRRVDGQHLVRVPNVWVKCQAAQIWADEPAPAGRVAREEG